MVNIKALLAGIVILSQQVRVVHSHPRCTSLNKLCSASKCPHFKTALCMQATTDCWCI